MACAVSDADALRERIRASLPVEAVPGIPEIRLHRAGPRSGLRQMAGGSPYWAHCWAGGLALARYVLDHPDVVRDKCVLDFGAGSGLVAIAAAKAGAKHVLAIDSDSNALVAVGLNAALNGVQIATPSVDPLDAMPPLVDLVLAGDVFYDDGLAQHVEAFLDRCRDAGILAIIGDPWRKHLPVERLRVLADYATPDFGSTKPVRSSVFAFVSSVHEG